MKTMKYIVLVIVILQIKSFSQESYLRLSPAETGKTIAQTTSLVEAMKCDNYNNIKISKPDGMFTKWNAPIWLTTNDLNIQFDDAASLWSDGTNSQLHIYTNSSDGTDVFFTEDIRYFPDPYGNAARSVSCSDGLHWVASTTNNVIYDSNLDEWIKRGRLVYNKTTKFQYIWSTATTTNGLGGPSYIPFKSMTLHELGHRLGLGHENSNTNSIMTPSFTSGKYFSLINSDYTWLVKLINKADNILIDDIEFTPSGGYRSTLEMSLFSITDHKGEGTHPQIAFAYGYETPPANITINKIRNNDASICWWSNDRSILQHPTTWWSAFTNKTLYVKAMLFDDVNPSVPSMRQQKSAQYAVTYHILPSTGIEDGIGFSQSNPNVVARYGTYNFNWQFFDAPDAHGQLGDYLVSDEAHIWVRGNKTEVELPIQLVHLTGGDHTIVTGNLPRGYYAWARDINGNVPARLEVIGVDNDGVHHIAEYCNLAISGVPNITIEGALTENETWTDNYLNGDVYVPATNTLTIKSGATVELNGHSIYSTGGSIIVEDGANVNCAYRIQNGSVKSVYPSVNLAVDSISSGQTVVALGNHSVYKDIIIPYGVTFQVNTNATLNFNPNTLLLVQGTLLASGATFKCPSGASSWKGIKLSGATDESYITSSQISNFGPGYGTDGIYIENCAPLIYNNYISGIYNGIKIYNASPTINSNYIGYCTNGNGLTIEGNSSPVISGNVISNNYYHGISTVYNAGNNYAEIFDNNINYNGGNNYTGIRAYGSGILAYRNSISSSNYGFYSESGSYIDFGTDYGITMLHSNGRNEVAECRYGLVAYDNSYIGAGIWDDSYGRASFNKITSVSNYSLYASINSTIYAQDNFWGGVNVFPTLWRDASSSVVWDPIQDLNTYESPGISGNRSLVSASESSPLNKVSTFNNNSKDEEDSAILQSWGLIKRGKYEEAKDILRNILEKGSIKALTPYLHLFFKSKDNDISEYLEKKSKKLSNNEDIISYKSTLVKLYASIGENNKALNLADELIEKGKKEAKIDKFLIHAIGFRDNNKALSILKEIEGELGKIKSDELYTLLLPDVENLDKAQGSLKKLVSDIEIKPTKYALSQNYPNPFNPTTTINYSVPTGSYVELKVYDVIGKEVTVLVNGFKEQGNYSVNFDASKLHSGIYFYTIKAGEFVATKKLMVLK